MKIEAKIMRQLFKLDPIVQKEARETRAFYYLLLAALLFIYGITLYESPDLRHPVRLIPFTLLMLLHGGLHWFSPYFVVPRRRLMGYLVLQTVLVVVLSLLGQGQAVSFGLTMALAGETVGMLEDLRHSLLALAGYLALLMVINYLIGGWQFVPTWLGTAVVMMVFVLIYVSMFMRQMNARQEAQSLLAELETTHQQLAAYAQKVETLTLETERQRMARELHDTLAQGLAGLILQIEGLEEHLEQGNMEKVADIAAQAKSRARTTLAEARQAISDLRRQSVDTTADAIVREVERFRQATGISCDLTLPETMALSDQLGEHVVRCVGEGLTNVMHHARATAVSVKLVVGNGRLQLTLHDNGQGFDPAQIPAGHYGLVGLRERARLANGQLTIDSQPNQGTTLTLTIPVETVKV
jgi:two-component system, NarL family, sensor histidine kinase YdfH